MPLGQGRQHERPLFAALTVVGAEPTSEEDLLRSHIAQGLSAPVVAQETVRHISRQCASLGGVVLAQDRERCRLGPVCFGDRCGSSPWHADDGERPKDKG
jgi:hypothetical protein